MHLSRFNYISHFERDGQRLLMNFLSQSAEIIDAESARFFSERKDTLSQEEKEYLLERGYLFRNKDGESAILKNRYKNELKNKKKQFVVLADNVDDNRALERTSKRIKALRKDNEAQSVVFYSERLLCDSFSLDPIIGLNSNFHADLITIPDNLILFEHPLRKMQISALTLKVAPADLEKSVPFNGNTESLLDWLIGHNMTVEFIIELRKNSTRELTRLMTYFICKGWPFLGNFGCTLAPECDEGCLFGLSYSYGDICKGIFSEYKAHPETEFFTLKRWVGSNVIQSLVWTGRLPEPSFHFCEASKGLTIFLADGQTVPCVRMARDPQVDVEGFRAKFLSKRLCCGDCGYLLSCGGGCIYNAKRGVQCPPVKDMIELATEFYFVEFLKRLAFNEKHVETAK